MGAGVGGLGEPNFKGVGLGATEAAAKIVDTAAIEKGKVAEKIALFEAKVEGSALPDAKKVGEKLDSPKTSQPGSKPIEIKNNPGITDPAPVVKKAIEDTGLPLPLVLEDDSATEAAPVNTERDYSMALKNLEG